MSGITDGYHQDLDEENFDNSETEVEFDDPEPEDDADSESEAVGSDEEPDFLNRFTAAIVNGLGDFNEDDDADPEDDDEIGLEDDDLEASEEEEDEEEAFLTDGFVTVSYVNNKLAFRKGDLQGEIFAYTEIEPSARGPYPPGQKLAIDGSKLYTSGPSKHPVEIQINHGNFMFFDLVANNSTGALLAEVDQLYDDNGDPLSHTLSTENHRPKVTLFFNPELLTLASKSAPVSVSTGFRAPVVQLPSFRASGPVVPPPSKFAAPNHRNTPSPPQPAVTPTPHGVHATPAANFHPPSVQRPHVSGFSEDRSRAMTGSPRSGINQFAPSITGPSISSEVSNLTHQGSLRPVHPHTQRLAVPEMSATTVPGVNDDLQVSRGPPKIRLKISTPSTLSDVSNSGLHSNTGAGAGTLPPPTGPRGGFTGGVGSLPGVKSINSYQDLLVIDQGETANMYASRAYLAGVINDAPLYLLGVERQFTPEAVIVISRMLNNRLWLKTRYSEVHDEILDLLVDICPELNGLPD